MYPETVKWKSLINMAPVDMRDFATQFMKIYNKIVSIVQFGSTISIYVCMWHFKQIIEISLIIM
jgi:hypothetical protein